MKNKKWNNLLIIIGIMSILVSGCSSATSKSEESIDKTEDMSTRSEAGYDTNYTPNAEGKDVASEAEETSTTESVEIQDTTRKLIRNINMGIETKEFDAFMDTMTEQIVALGGYIQSSEIQGNSYASSGNRYSNVVARIPEDKFDGFVSKVSEIGNVTSKNESAEDVTLQYVDMESRKKALQVEQDRLFELLAKAEGLEAILTIEGRLSEIRYQIESYEAQIRTYDNQVEYSTVTIRVSEVERIIPVDDQSMIDKVKIGFSDNASNILLGLKNFTIWLLVSIPYLLLWGIIVASIVLVCKKVIKKRTSKMENVEKKKPENQKQEK